MTAVLCESSVEEFAELRSEIKDLGIRMSVSLIHDGKGHITIEGYPYTKLWEESYQDSLPFSYLDYDYGRNLLEGKRPEWKCRSGSRYLYVDEFGKVQYCATQLGRLDKPVEDYSIDDVRRESRTHKGCESGCSMLCSYRCSVIDNDRIGTVKSLLKGCLKGSMSDSSTHNQ